MIWIIIIFLAVLCIAVLFLKNKTRDIEAQYKKREALFTPAERSFLGVLNQAIDDNAIIFGKVRVADIIKPNSWLSRKKWQTLFNKISSKHFDFVICDKHDLSVLCAIELDDKSHNSKIRKKRDAFLQSACLSANLPLIQVPAKPSYNIDEIRKSLITRLSSTNNTDHKNAAR